MYEYRALLHRTIDGDTIDVVLDLGFNIRKTERLRLAAINAPERGQEGYEQACAFVVECLAGKVLRVKTYKDKKDGFGRYLADVYFDDDDHLNELMLQRGYAKPYVR